MEIKCDTSNLGEVLKSLLKDSTPITLKIDNGKVYSISAKIDTEPQEKEQEAIVIESYDDRVDICIDHVGRLCKVLDRKGEKALCAQSCFRQAEHSCRESCIDFSISENKRILTTCMKSYHINLIPVDLEE